MKPESNTLPAGVPVPWRCHRCRQKEVRPAVIPYRAQIRHDGCLHTVDVPHLTVPRCALCGELLFDDRANEQVSQAFRAQMNLLTSDQIKDNRTVLGLSPQELSSRLGMPPETVGQLEEGLLIQSRALDNLLRVFFAVPQARTMLDTTAWTPAFGILVTPAG